MKNFDKNKYPNCFKGHQYAKDVLEGKIVACKYIIGACQRYLKDIERDDLILDLEWAERFMRMFQKFENVIGEWKTANIILEPWQCFFFLNIEGFYWKKTKKRKYKEAMLEVSRGNGKSTKLSVTGLIYLSLYRTVKGNKVYAASTKKDQSRIVLDAARVMALKNQSYLKHTGTKVYAHHIAHEKTGSEFKALSSDSNGLDGLAPVLSIIDELHAHKTREIYDVMATAMSKRHDSVLICITTAGFSLDGIGYSQSCYAKKVALGDIEDETFFSLIYTLDEGDDWTDEKNWLKSNPNWGVSVDVDSFRAKAFKAVNNPQDEVNFKVKHLNVWQNSAFQFFNIKKWEALANPNIKMEDFKNEACYVGIDLASKVDITSFAYIFKNKETDKYTIFVDNFIPKETLDESRNVMYRTWADKGHLIVTEGSAVSLVKLQERFVENSRKYSIQAAHYDPWNATELSQRMSMENIEMVKFNMNTSNMSEPMKKLDALIKEGKIEHNGNPLVSWCLGNVVAKVDANDNVFPRKEHESMKIDPIVAIIMALAGWVKMENERSVYEERGLIIF